MIERLGEQPTVLNAVEYRETPKAPAFPDVPHKKALKQLVGVDVFLDWAPGKPDTLGEQVRQFSEGPLALEVITNRGIKVWPDGIPETFCTDHWRCRFRGANDAPVTPAQVVKLLEHMTEAGLDVIKTENLYTFDGVPGYSAVPG